jgi:hypothetical protein
LFGCKGGDDEQREEEIAKALEDRLSEALDFEGGAVVPGAPPEEHAGDPNYPQTNSFDAPSVLVLGQPFSVKLAAADSAVPADVSGAVVHVVGASSYIDVKAGVDVGTRIMELLGRLREDKTLAGAAFTIRLGMHDMSTRVGNYLEWKVNVVEVNEVESETWYDSASNLTWKADTPAHMNWADAKSYCANLGGGWHLPTISELRSLIRGCATTVTGGSCGVKDSCLSSESCWNSDCKGCGSAGGPASGCYWPSEMKGSCWIFWSSSPVADADGYVWVVDFLDSFFTQLDVGNDLSDDLGVRCVR